MAGTTTAGRSRGSLALAAFALATLTLITADTSTAGPPADETVALPIVSYTGAQEFRVIPEGIHTAHVVAIGATGANASSGTVLGGLGARVEGDISVTPGTLFVNVGGDAFATDGGFNGGADGALSVPNTNLGGGGGGGASDVRTVASGVTGSLESRLIVAAGGGGAGSSGGYLQRRTWRSRWWRRRGWRQRRRRCRRDSDRPGRRGRRGHGQRRRHGRASRHQHRESRR